MAYANSYIHMFKKVIESDKELAFQIKRCAEIDFGYYGGDPKKSGGTIIAHIRWNLDEAKKNIISCRFEGIPDAVHTLTLDKPLPVDNEDRPTDADVERIMAHWKGFTDTMQKRYDEERAARNQKSLTAIKDKGADFSNMSFTEIERESVRNQILTLQHQEEPLTEKQQSELQALIDQERALDARLNGPRIDPEVDPIHYV